MRKDFHEDKNSAKNSKSIRVTVIRRKFATNQLSVCEFFCQDLEQVERELKGRYSLDLNKEFICPILSEDETSYAGLLDMEFWMNQDGTAPELIDGFSYRVIIDSDMAAPRDYAFAEFPDEE